MLREELKQEIDNLSEEQLVKLANFFTLIKVRLDNMKAYNQINLLNGYGILTIVSPKEVILDEFNQD